MLEENTPLIETERLILRKFTQQDLNEVYQIFSDQEVNRFLPWFPVQSMTEGQNYLDTNILSVYQEPTAYYYAITMKGDGRAIGYINVSNVRYSNDLGYGLRKNFWHMGVTSEAAQGLINHLKQVDFPYLTATHDVKNPHSGGVMKKIGMTYRYTYETLVQPKNRLVYFRLYQVNLDGIDRIYKNYWDENPIHFIENSTD